MRTLDPRRLRPEDPVLLSLGGIRFAHFCRTYIRHTKGAWARQPLLLEPWQILMFSELLRTEPGTMFQLERRDLDDPWELFETAIERPDYEVEVGRRIYREAYIQTAEKTGKSTTAAALELYLLGWDGEDGSEVYTGATTVQQAKIIFDQAKSFVDKSPSLTAALTTYKETIYHQSTDSVFRVLSSEAMHDEGLNPHGVVLDELWAHPNRELYDALTSRIYSGTRLDPLAVSLSNAGTDTESIAYELYLQVQAIMKAEPQARDDLLGFVPEVPKGAEDDPDGWIEANPQSWVTRDMLVKASRRQPPNVFRRRRLNMWVSGEEGWLPDGAWEACEDKALGIDLEEIGIFDPSWSEPIFVGVDIGQKRDHSAVTCTTWLPDEELLAIWTETWALWADKSTTPPDAHNVIEQGDKVPVGLPEQHIMWLAEEGYYIAEVGYDPYKFVDPAERLDALGFVMIEWPQTDARMVPASEGLFELITDRGLVHNGGRILTAHVLAGVAVEAAQARGWRLHKGRAKKPTDALIGGVISTALARPGRAEGRPTIERMA